MLNSYPILSDKSFPMEMEMEKLMKAMMMPSGIISFMRDNSGTLGVGNPSGMAPRTTTSCFPAKSNE